MSRLVGILIILVVPLTPFMAQTEESPDIHWVTIGEGVGLHETLQTALVIRPSLSWVSLDFSVGTFFLMTINLRLGLSLYLNQDFLSCEASPSDSFFLHADIGQKNGFMGESLASDPPQDTPPSEESIVNLSAGYAWLWEAFELRLVAGADYRWGKKPSPRENRAYFESDWAPTLIVIFGARLL